MSNYKYVLGSFRLRDPEVIDKAAWYAKKSNRRILVDTGVSYNVDHIIGRRSFDNVDMMTKFGVDHLLDFDWYVENHLKYLKVDHLEYALVHFYEPNWKLLVALMKKCPKISKVGVSNFNIQQLIEYYEEFGEYPVANQIEFSINYHDLDLVNFCNSNNIEVFGYGVLGGIHESKQCIRNYTVDGLLHYALSNNVIPILRSDSILHFNELRSSLYSYANNQLISKLSVSTGNYEYDLSEDNKDPRALNKFRYDHPAYASKFSLLRGDDYEDFLTLDPSHMSLQGNFEVIFQKLSKESLEVLEGYEEIPREFMMITDYLVKDRYSNPDYMTIWTSDDMIYLTDANTTKLISYVLLDDENSLIKSGSCHARVFRKEIVL